MKRLVNTIMLNDVLNVHATIESLHQIHMNTNANIDIMTILQLVYGKGPLTHQSKWASVGFHGFENSKADQGPHTGRAPPCLKYFKKLVNLFCKV